MANKRGQPINGWINLNKPIGISSAQAVGKVKWLLKPQKIGHAGTLDPLATGILPLALGEGTKCVNLLMDAKKTYEFSVTFGEQRATGDAEGEVVARSDHRPNAVEIEAVLPQFTGPIEQMPPAYSALKIDGKRAYELARAGEKVVLKSRQVTVHTLKFLGLFPSVIPAQAGIHEGSGEQAEIMNPGLRRDDMNKVEARFQATVSKGTYIRSLGQDIAAAAGTVGYISRLHRSAVGPFTDKDAISLDFLAESAHKAAPTGETGWLLPLRVALDDIPAHSLTAQQFNQLRHGQQALLAAPTPDTALAAVLYEGELVGLVRIEANHLVTQRLLNISPDVAKEKL